MTTSKSPKRVLQLAYYIGQLVLPDYSHRFSPQTYTQPQLFACLVLKEFLQFDYRKLAALLQDAGELAAVIGLARVPHFTTFQKASARLLANRHAQRFLDKTIRFAQVATRQPVLPEALRGDREIPAKSRLSLFSQGGPAVRHQDASGAGRRA
jgi:hypothetical protein